jgi:hypothetical protein
MTMMSTNNRTCHLCSGRATMADIWVMSHRVTLIGDVPENGRPVLGILEQRMGDLHLDKSSRIAVTYSALAAGSELLRRR